MGRRTRGRRNRCFHRRYGPAAANFVRTETAMPANLAPPAPPGAEGGVPDWFARGRIVREVRAAEEAVKAAEETHRDDTPPLRRALKWIVGGAAAGYAVSLTFHSLVLLGCSLIVFNLGKGGGPTVS